MESLYSNMDIYVPMLFNPVSPFLLLYEEAEPMENKEVCIKLIHFVLFLESTEKLNS